MRVTIRRAALIAASVAGVAGCAPAATAAPALTPALTASVTSWHIVTSVHSGPMGDFTAVTPVGRTGGWAFNRGSAPTAWRLSGSSWTQVPFPGLASEKVVAASAVSPSDVWAFTSNGTEARAVRWNGSTWAVVRSFPGQIVGAAVLGASDVWVFGGTFNLGAWHYNGRTWSQPASGRGLKGGSGLSAGDIWAFEGTDVAHWNGSAWSRASLAALLPARQQQNDPMLTGIYAQSRDSVYAIGNGNGGDQGGPLVILHWNGSAWSRVAQGNYGFGTTPLQQVSPDGRGGLWIPMPGYVGIGLRGYMLHYSAGRLTSVGLPDGPYRMSVDAVALIAGTTDLLGGGATHSAANADSNVTAVILRYGT